MNSISEELGQTRENKSEQIASQSKDQRSKSHDAASAHQNDDQYEEVIKQTAEGLAEEDIEMSAEDNQPIADVDDKGATSQQKEDQDMKNGQEEDVEAPEEVHLSEANPEDQAETTSRGRPKRNVKKPNKEMPQEQSTRKRKGKSKRGRKPSLAKQQSVKDMVKSADSQRAPCLPTTPSVLLNRRNTVVNADALVQSEQSSKKDSHLEQLTDNTKEKGDPSKQREARNQGDQQQAKQVPLSPAVLEWKQKEVGMLQQGHQIFNSLKQSLKSKPEDKAESGAGVEVDALQFLTESEKTILLEDVTAFLTSGASAATDASSPPALRDICKVPIFKLIAHIVDSSTLGIEELKEKCHKVVVHNLKLLLQEKNHDLSTADNLDKIDSIFGEKENDNLGAQAPACSTLIQDLIKINAERRHYGFRTEKRVPHAIQEDSQIKEDDDPVVKSDDAKDSTIGSMEVWELTNASHFYLSAARCKDLQQLQRQRMQANSELKLLEKVLLLLDRAKTEKDIAKVKAEHDRYLSLVQKGVEAQRKVQAHLEQQRERARIEHQKLQLREKEKELKAQERARLTLEKQREKQMREEQLQKEKQEKAERLAEAKKLADEKKAKEEEERRLRQLQLEKEKKERQEEREREKEERQRAKEAEKLEKLRKQKEEEERKLREEEERERLRPNITRFFGKVKDENQSKEQMSISQSQKDETVVDRVKELEKQIDARLKTYLMPTESLQQQKRFQLLALNNPRPVPNFSEVENGNSDETEKDNKREIAEYFKMMNSKVDVLMHARNNNIQITYPVQDRNNCIAVLDNQRDQMPQGTVIIKHTSPKKEQSASRRKENLPNEREGPFVAKQVVQRKKCIIIEDEIKSLLCWKSFHMDNWTRKQQTLCEEPSNGIFAAEIATKPQGMDHEGVRRATTIGTCKRSLLTCRNPFKVDEGLINYLLDSEDEWAEENGEDLQDADCQKLSDDDEDDLAEQEAAKGFIVDDDYLSVSEMNYSFESDMANNDALLQADLQRRKAILEKKRQNQLHLKNCSLSEGPQIYLYDPKSSEVNWADYAAVSFMSPFQTSASEAFPLEPKKIKVNIDYEAEDKKSGFDPNAINLKLVELVRMVHGSFDSKPKLIDDFHEQHPECSKNSIERRLKDYFVKDRREDDPRQRYYACDTVLALVDDALPPSALAEMARAKLQPILEEIQIAEREQEEKRRSEMLQKEQERIERDRIKKEELEAKEQKRKEEKIERDREREEIKEQKRLQAEEEKQRKREDKQKQKQMKAQQKEREMAQKKEAKMEKNREKERQLEIEKERKQKKYKTKKKLQLGGSMSAKQQKAESVISMLKKRQSTDLKVKRVMESNNKILKVEDDARKEGKGVSAEKSQSATSNVCQITSFFQKRPGPSFVSPQTLKNCKVGKKAEKEAAATGKLRTGQHSSDSIPAKSPLAGLLSLTPTTKPANTSVHKKETGNKSGRGKSADKGTKDSASLSKGAKNELASAASAKPGKAKKSKKVTAELQVKEEATKEVKQKQKQPKSKQKGQTTASASAELDNPKPKTKRQTRQAKADSKQSVAQK